MPLVVITLPYLVEISYNPGERSDDDACLPMFSLFKAPWDHYLL